MNTEKNMRFQPICEIRRDALGSAYLHGNSMIALKCNTFALFDVPGAAAPPSVGCAGPEALRKEPD